MLCHTTLSTYYEMVFSLAQHHKYSIVDIETMLPYERDLYFQLLINFIEEQKEKNS
jgi:hypothetical protein